MNYFYGMVDRRNAFSLISSRNHCQRSPPLQISDTRREGFEPAENLNSGLIEQSCAVVIMKIVTIYIRINQRKTVFNMIQPIAISEIYQKERTLTRYYVIKHSKLLTIQIMINMTIDLHQWPANSLLKNLIVQEPVTDLFNP